MKDTVLDKIQRNNLITCANRVITAVNSIKANPKDKDNVSDSKFILNMSLRTFTLFYIEHLLNKRLTSKSDKQQIFKIITKLIDNN